jgi:hypothetical protein
MTDISVHYEEVSVLERSESHRVYLFYPAISRQRAVGNDSVNVKRV